ncbi:MAG: hypothetical protein ACREXP_08495 [Steroidobacteraceae bacterium]
MGEAKRRGSKGQRVQTARAAIEAVRPEFIECGRCHTHVTQLEPMNTRAESGLTAVFAGICPSCSYQVWAFSGDPQAVKNAMLAMQQLANDDHGIASPNMEIETFLGTAERRR